MNKFLKEMKEQEEIFNYRIPKRNTMVIRVDGKNFKKVTEKLQKPFDIVFSSIMQGVMNEVAPQITGCDIAYTQSDEITFILHNKENETPYFGGRIQKIVSVVSSIVSLTFYRLFLSFIMEYQDKIEENKTKVSEEDMEQLNERLNNLWTVLNQNPVFDARIFTVAPEDEEDVLEIRQNNCINNSINTMAHYYIGNVSGKTQDDLLKELYKIGNRWEDLPEVIKFGSCIIRNIEETDDGKIKRKWIQADFIGHRARTLKLEEENRQEAKRLAEKKKNESL